MIDDLLCGDGLIGRSVRDGEHAEHEAGEATIAAGRLCAGLGCTVEEVRLPVDGASVIAAFQLFAAALAIVCGMPLDGARAQGPRASGGEISLSACRGGRCEGLRPGGWVLEANATGDGDGRDDLVLVLHQHDPANVLVEPNGGDNPLDSNPRILAVAVACRSGSGYRLAVENHELIPRHADAFVFDGFGDERGGVSVARGAFSVLLGFETNAGSWMQSSRRLTFRLVGGRRVLIGFDDETRDRRDDSTMRVSAVCLTRRWLIEKTAGEDAPTKVRRGRTPSVHYFRSRRSVTAWILIPVSTWNSGRRAWADEHQDRHATHRAATCIRV